MMRRRRPLSRSGTAAGWQVAPRPGHRPFLPEYDRTTPIVPYDVKRILADIDADHGDALLDF
jgi:hypothetical protein